MKKRWNAQLIPYEEVFELDDSVKLCIEITEQQLALILSQTPYLYWSPRYIRDDAQKLSAAQRLNIKTKAAILEAALLEARECSMGYTVELDGCNIVLKNNGVIVSSVDLEDCVSPPIHMAFDAANCNLVYTQGNIYSPYVGGDWNTVIDWNIDSFRQCLIPAQQPPKAYELTTTICDIAVGTATYILQDVLFIHQEYFDALSVMPYPLAIGILADVSFAVRQWWDATGLSRFVSLAPVPDQPMLDTYASLEARVLLTQKFYCAMSIDVDGNISFDGTQWFNDMMAGFFSVNVRDAVLAYVTQNGMGDLLRQYFIKAALNFTGSDCSAVDCYTLPECVPYTDLMIGGLGAQTRLFDASHPYNGSNSGTIVDTGYAGGKAIKCDVYFAGGGGGQWKGGFFVDMGRECLIETLSFWYASNGATSSNWPTSLDVDMYNGAGAFMVTYHFSRSNAVSPTFAQLAFSPNRPNTRYVVIRAESWAGGGETGQQKLSSVKVNE